jgi:hypothetical protein
VSESERDSCRELSESSVGRRSRVPFGLGFGAHFRRLLEMGEAMGRAVFCFCGALYWSLTGVY